jgi:hypothetical protein
MKPSMALDLEERISHCERIVENCDKLVKQQELVIQDLRIINDVQKEQVQALSQRNAKLERKKYMSGLTWTFIGIILGGVGGLYLRR